MVKEILDIINTTLEPRTRDGVTPKLPQPIMTDANEQEHVDDGNGDREPSLNDPAIDDTASTAAHTHKVGDTDHGKDDRLQQSSDATRNNDEAEPGLRSKLEDVLLEKSHAPSSQSKDDSQDMSVDDSGAAARTKKKLTEQSSKDNNNKEKDDPMDIDWTIFTDTGEIDAQTTELKFDRAPGSGGGAAAATAMMMGNVSNAKKSLMERGKGAPLLHAGINDISVGSKPPEEGDKTPAAGESSEEQQQQGSKSPWNAGITDISVKPSSEKDAGTGEQEEEQQQQDKSPMDAGTTNDIS